MCVCVCYTQGSKIVDRPRQRGFGAREIGDVDTVERPVIAPVNGEQGHTDKHLTRTGIAGFVHADEFHHVGRIARLRVHRAQAHKASLRRTGSLSAST